MNYTPSYKKTWLSKQKSLEMIHGNEEESYVKLPKLLGALQSCVPETVVATKKNPCLNGRNRIGQKKCLNVSFGYLVHAIGLHIANS